MLYVDGILMIHHDGEAALIHHDGEAALIHHDGEAPLYTMMVKPR